MLHTIPHAYVQHYAGSKPGGGSGRRHPPPPSHERPERQSPNQAGTPCVHSARRAAQERRKCEGRALRTTLKCAGLETSLLQGLVLNLRLVPGNALSHTSASFQNVLPTPFWEHIAHVATRKSSKRGVYTSLKFPRTPEHPQPPPEPVPAAGRAAGAPPGPPGSRRTHGTRRAVASARFLTRSRAGTGASRSYRSSGCFVPSPPQIPAVPHKTARCGDTSRTHGDEKRTGCPRHKAGRYLHERPLSAHPPPVPRGHREPEQRGRCSFLRNGSILLRKVLLKNSFMQRF